MAKSITVRDVPEATAAELAARAARGGRSLQEYLRQRLIELAERPDAQTWVSAVRERKAAAPSQLSAQAILVALDDGRR